MRKIALLSVFALVAVSAMSAMSGCVADPNDPKTWIKKLDDPRESKEAVRMLVKLKDKQAVAPLIELFKKTHDPEHLRAVAAFEDPSSVAVLSDSLDYSEESFDTASIAATALGEIGDKSAVDSLIKAVLKPLPIKTRANVVKLEAMKSLGKIKDPRAVDALVKVLSTPADDQDFYLNQVAAKSLGEFADPKAVPALVRGLFMTGRGASIYQECRAALVSIGEPSVATVILAMQHKFPELEADAKKYEYNPGIIVQKTGFILGDLRSKAAIPALLEELAKKDEGIAAGEGKGVPAHQGTAVALGLIGDPRAFDPLVAVLKDGKRSTKERVAAAEALNMLGDPRAVPVLLAAAQVSFLDKKTNTLDGEAAAVVAGAVTAYSRLAGPDAKKGFFKPPEDLEDMAEVAKAADDRIGVANDCKADIACLDKAIVDGNSNKAEKAAFMLARLGKPGLDTLANHLGTSDPVVRMTILYGIGRLADRSSDSVIKALDKQIVTDESKPPLRPLVQEMRVVRAGLSH